MSNYEDRLNAAGSEFVEIQNRKQTAVTAASAPAALATVQLTNEVQSRQVLDSRPARAVQMLVELGGTVVAATKIALQIHPGGDPNVASGDAGWVTLVTSDGSHAAGTPFLTKQVPVPAALCVPLAVLRVVFYDGNGAAVPSVARATAMLYA